MYGTGMDWPWVSDIVIIILFIYKVGIKSFLWVITQKQLWFVILFISANNLKKAFQAIANFLVFSPNDKQMLQNKNFYINTEGHKEEDFIPNKVSLNLFNSVLMF